MIELFLDSIPGMDMVFKTEPPKGSIILVCGSAGTLKSAFTYNLITNEIRKRPNNLEQGVYVTLEETKESLLRNVKNMGISPSERVRISDIASFMRDMDYWSGFVTNEADYIDLILEKASRPFRIYQNNALEPLHEEGGDKSKGGGLESVLTPSLFVLDSLNALNAIVNRGSHGLRKEMNEFLFKLREKDITSFIIMEVGDACIHRPEYFLVDGIIELGIKETEKNRYQRFFRVHKMRSTKHSIEPFVMEVSDTGIKLVEELI